MNLQAFADQAAAVGGFNLLTALAVLLTSLYLLPLSTGTFEAFEELSGVLIDAFVSFAFLGVCALMTSGLLRLALLV